MIKNVKKGDPVTTVVLDGTECKIVFDCFNEISFPFYRAFAVQNDSLEDVVLSTEQGKTENDDGVIIVHPGMSAVLPHMKNLNTCFVTGTGSVQVAALNTLTNPFKSAPANGQGGGGDLTEITFNGDYHAGDILNVEIITTENKSSGDIEILCNGVIVQTADIGNILYYGVAAIVLEANFSGEITVRATSTDVGILGIYTPYIMTPMTADTTETPDGNIIATASSVYQNASAYQAFDGSIGSSETCWHPQGSAPQWIAIEFPIAVCLKEFTMYNRTNYIECPKDVIFQCSEDGETWIDIISFVFSEHGGSGQSKSVKTNNSECYRYYRWYLSSVHSYGVISEIEFDTILKSNNVKNRNIQITQK